MDRKRLFIHLAVFIFFISIINYAATRFYWYSSLPYFDIPMHFFGGFWLGLAFIYLFKYQKTTLQFFAKVILGVFIIGFAWEIYEIVVNNLFAQNPFDLPDTLYDLFFDLLGGFVAIFYFLKIIKSKNSN